SSGRENSHDGGLKIVRGRNACRADLRLLAGFPIFVALKERVALEQLEHWIGQRPVEESRERRPDRANYYFLRIGTGDDESADQDILASLDAKPRRDVEELPRELEH